MGVSDVKDTLDQAIAVTGVTSVVVKHRPRLLSDNGSAYLSGELKAYLANHQMTHTHGAPYHPVTRGKIERYHRTMKNVVKLEHYYLPGAHEQAIGQFVQITTTNATMSHSITSRLPICIMAVINRSWMTGQ